MSKHKRKHKDTEVDEDGESLELTRVSAKNDTWDEPLYLSEGEEAVPVIHALVPPDVRQCQCEWADHDTDTFGPRLRVRCDQPPTVVAFQRRRMDDDSPTGAMSLCDDHKLMLEHMFPGQCYYRTITADRKIGDIVPK